MSSQRVRVSIPANTASACKRRHSTSKLSRSLLTPGPYSQKVGCSGALDEYGVVVVEELELDELEEAAG